MEAQLGLAVKLFYVLDVNIWRRLIMSRSNFWILMSAIYVSHVVPAVGQLIIATICLGLAIYSEMKE